jgi:hypothetical protein
MRSYPPWREYTNETLRILKEKLQLLKRHTQAMERFPEQGHEIIYYLATHRDEFKRIARMKPARRVEELAKRKPAIQEEMKRERAALKLELAQMKAARPDLFERYERTKAEMKAKSQT